MEETIKGLTQTISKLREENEKLYKYREAYSDISRQCRELKKMLDTKRSVFRIVGYYDDDPNCGYLLQIMDSSDSPRGMFIKVRLTPLINKKEQ